MRSWTESLRRAVLGTPARPRQRAACPLGVEALEERQLLSGNGYSTAALNERFVGQLYEDLLGRSVDAAGMSTFADTLNQGHDRSQVYVGIVGSAEFRAHVVEGLFTQYLNRPADPAGLSTFEGLLASGSSMEHIKSLILGSEEYLQNHGGTNTSFVAALYLDVLGRPADASGAALWTGQLAQGTSRTQVALELLTSTEAYQVQVTADYEKCLQRDPDSAGLNTWVSALQQGQSDLVVLCNIIISNEKVTDLQDDPVLDWNAIMLQAIRTDKTPPPQASRNMAIVQLAVYDAINAIDSLHANYDGATAAAANASPAAAAIAAAHSALDALYPAQAATFDAAYASSLAALPDSTSKMNGIAVGIAAANKILALRSNDGSSAVVPYTPGSGPGVWVPTPPKFLPALDPQWPMVTPFAMASGSQFRPPPPPALSSDAFVSAYNEVMAYGNVNSTVRTADQTQIAEFWADNPGATATPPGHWNEIVDQVAVLQGNTLAQNARSLALLDMAMADAAIVAWDAKYTYNFWRPVTAIQNANSAGNPQLVQDSSWMPLLVTPNFPTYTSGHSTFSGAADSVLTAIYGANFSFTTTSDALPGVTRSFSSFSAAANEAGQSRIYAGIHYQFDNQNGLASGRALGAYVVENFLQ
jgi:hypothetical protein